MWGRGISWQDGKQFCNSEISIGESQNSLLESLYLTYQYGITRRCFSGFFPGIMCIQMSFLLFSWSVIVLHVSLMLEQPVIKKMFLCFNITCVFVSHACSPKLLSSNELFTEYNQTHMTCKHKSQAELFFVMVCKLIQSTQYFNK
jgi:hypothetical protein